MLSIPDFGEFVINTNCPTVNGPCFWNLVANFLETKLKMNHENIVKLLTHAAEYTQTTIWQAVDNADAERVLTYINEQASTGIYTNLRTFTWGLWRVDMPTGNQQHPWYRDFLGNSQTPDLPMVVFGYQGEDGGGHFIGDLNTNLPNTIGFGTNYQPSNTAMPKQSKGLPALALRSSASKAPAPRCKEYPCLSSNHKILYLDDEFNDFQFIRLFGSGNPIFHQPHKKAGFKINSKWCHAMCVFSIYMKMAGGKPSEVFKKICKKINCDGQIFLKSAFLNHEIHDLITTKKITKAGIEEDFEAQSNIYNAQLQLNRVKKAYKQLKKLVKKSLKKITNLMLKNLIRYL